MKMMGKFDSLIKAINLPATSPGDLLWIHADMPDEDLDDLSAALNNFFENKVAFMLSTFNVTPHFIPKEAKHVIIFTDDLGKSDLSQLRKSFRKTFPDHAISFLSSSNNIEILSGEDNSRPSFSFDLKQSDVEDVKEFCGDLLKSFPQATFIFNS